jgi:hypothetical protein
MKTLLFFSAVLLAATPAWVQDTKTSDTKGATATQTKQVSAEVVSTDKTAKTITIKTASYASSMATAKTLVAKVDEKTVALLDTVKPGQKVTLTCMTDKERECETVTGIKKVPATSPNDAPNDNDKE